jgi:(E)-4-hydroxy-3-methylbut-2-enyl-diphosphate synthase
MKHQNLMITRKKTRSIRIGSLKIGGKNPIVLQSMTKTDTTDIKNCLKHIHQLVEAGAGLVRVAVPTGADTRAFARLTAKSPVPLVADIHFSPERAIEAIEAGAAKIRLNPGNVKNKQDIKRILDCAKQHRIAIRIGVNEASIRDLQQDVKKDRRVSLMLDELTGYVRFFERNGFENLVLSAKSASTVRTIEINRAISERFDYPIHIGLTHAGLKEDAIIPSSVAVGTLLAEGIGDTVRISIAGDPVQEIEVGKQILNSLGLYRQLKPELIVCPTCGRCEVDVVALAGKVRNILMKIDKPIRVAVMGCVVNGPGEAADADLAICAGSQKGFLYKNGQKIAVVEEKKLLDVFTAELKKIK